MLINENKSYNQENWSDWVNKEIATAVPGSLDFLIMLNHWVLKLFILSNRRVENYEATKSNLIKLGFPFDESTVMLLRDETRDKLKRRSSIKDYEVIMLIGDNLGDFDSAFFFGKTNKERWEVSVSLKEILGKSSYCFQI